MIKFKITPCSLNNYEYFFAKYECRTCLFVIVSVPCIGAVAGFPAICPYLCRPAFVLSSYLLHFACFRSFVIYFICRLGRCPTARWCSFKPTRKENLLCLSSLLFFPKKYVYFLLILKYYRS